MKTRSLFLVALLTTVGSAAAADRESPYVIDAKRFAKEVRRVAVAPVDAPAWMGMPADQRAAIDAGIAARLAKARFEVIPASEFAAIQARLVGYLGGLEGADGKFDPERQKLVREHAVREMLRLHRFDALLLPRIIRTDVPWADDRVEWDGVKATVQAKGGGKFSGKIAVASLEVRFVDRSERPLYLGYGGLEPLMHRQEQQLHPLPPERLWKDPKRPGKAVDLAMKAL